MFVFEISEVSESGIGVYIIFARSYPKTEFIKGITSSLSVMTAKFKIYRKMIKITKIDLTYVKYDFLAIEFTILYIGWN
jgi:hypothetical protein